MESLLANYGSDDEEDEGHQEPPPRIRASLFASLPPPKLFGEDPARRSSLFASLPPPKFAGEDTRKPDFRVSSIKITDSNDEEKASEIPLLASHRDADIFNHPETEESRPDDAFRVSNAEVSDVTRGKDVGMNADGANGAPKSKRFSLFGALPPPKNTGPSLVPLQSQPLPAPSSKRVVQLRPNINMALLKDLDDDDYDAQPQAKRHATDAVGSSKATGLAAILPKPKNVGTTLGSGYTSGHHATLDVGASVNIVPSPSVAINSEFAPQSVHDPSSFPNHHLAETGNSYEHLGGSHVSASPEAWEGYNQDICADSLTHADAVQFNGPSYQSDSMSHEGAVLCPEGYYGVPDDYSEGMLAHETSNSKMSSAQDPIAHMLLKERRKGGKNAPLNIVEVKQADLTATKLREDQLRVTGIAFGPAYQPVSSSKGKPSKLHRRKHQIGSLYYDMKQKEMELMERRARGHMTKAETQGKYGW